MERERDSILEHMPLEEIRIEEISFLEPPQGWDGTSSDEGPGLPPVLAEENRRYVLLGNHRTLWKAIGDGKNAIRSFVVRSAVHIEIAHKSIRNCAEEALLFQGLLQSGIIANRSRLAELLGYSRARITQVLNLLKLPVEIRRKILLTDGISEFQLRPLIRIDDEARQQSMFDRLLAQKLTGRQMAVAASRGEAARTGAGEVVGEEAEAEQDASSEEILNDAFPTILADEAPSVVSDAPRSRVEIPGPGRERRPLGIESMLPHLGTLRQPEWEKQAVNMGVSDQDMLFLRGVSLIRRGLYREAVDRLEDVLAQSPEHAVAYFYLGRCHNLLGDPVAAEVSIRNAVELRPGNPDYLTELAIVLEKLNRHSEAASCYRRAGALRKLGDGARDGQ
jgi:ParB-like chromosome segregation protein Spo0J